MPAAAPVPPRRRPPGRYDEPSRLAQRLVAITLVVLIAGLVAAVSWTLYQRYGRPQVSYQLVNYHVDSDREVSVTFEVAPPAGKTVTCLVRARSRSFAEVGHVFVPVVGRGGTVTVSTRFPTTARAVNGEVPICSLSAAPSGEPVAPTAFPTP